MKAHVERNPAVRDRTKPYGDIENNFEGTWAKNCVFFAFFVDFGFYKCAYMAISSYFRWF
jgi:hypothetical protein